MEYTKCYKSVQSFRVTCLFTGQYDTGEFGTIAGVMYFDQLLLAVSKWHIVYSHQLLGAAQYTLYI